MAQQEHIPARIVTIVQETPTIRSFVLDTGGRYTGLPGQWIDVVQTIDGETKAAGLSPTSVPNPEGRVQVAVKRAYAHPVTQWLYEEAKEGDTVAISHGSGSFHYTPERGRKVVLIGGGVGVTPLVSIFRYIDEQVPDAEAHLIYSVAQAREILFQEELERRVAENPRLDMTVTVTGEPGTWGGLTRYVDAELIEEQFLDPEALYYLCGPNAMVDSMAECLPQLGIPEDQVIFERWW